MTAAARLTVAEEEAISFAADHLVLTSREQSVTSLVGSLFRITPARRQALVQLAVELYGRLGVRCCHGCGCTNEIACAGGCGWTRPNWCSQCAPPSEPPPKKKRRRRG